MSQYITVADYNPLWGKKYEEQSFLIREILTDNCIAIYHIGSTSVPGLAAKPIIDIMAVVRSLEQVDCVAEIKSVKQNSGRWKAASFGISYYSDRRKYYSDAVDIVPVIGYAIV